MKNLVIGNTSQLARYFPREGNDFISSRNIDVGKITSRKWNRIYLCSAEQRTFMKTAGFEDYNVKTTIGLIDQIKDSCENLIVYSTAELWNKVHGEINLSMDHKFNPSPYIVSKKKMTDILTGNREKYSNVIILYPFNFNSTHRSPGFLFAKIFDSILNKKKIQIGNTYFYRELLHPSYVAKKSIELKEHTIIGSGRTIFVNDFIRHLYQEMGMEYEEYVTENIDNTRRQERDIYFLDSKVCLYSYSELLSDTVNDMKRRISERLND